MKKIDLLLIQFLIWARAQPLLYRFTLGSRVLLAVAFIPTGMVKVLGMRFSTLGTEYQAGAFFEMLYQSGYYWQFLGATQVIAGVLILFERTAAFGSVMFLGIISNIYFITISYEFAYTSFVAFGMLLASIWVAIWNWHKIRYLFIGIQLQLIELPNLTLSTAEKAVYLSGLISGLIVFSFLRGLIIPMPLFYIILLLMVISFIMSIILGIIYRNLKM